MTEDEHRIVMACALLALVAFVFSLIAILFAALTY